MFAHPSTNFAQFADDGTACRERGTFEVGLGAGLEIAGEVAVLTRLTCARHFARAISSGDMPASSCNKTTPGPEPLLHLYTGSGPSASLSSKSLTAAGQCERLRS